MATTYKLFKRFGCGCTGLVLGDKLQLVIDYCGDSDGLHIMIGDRIRKENIDKAEDLTDHEHEKLFDRMNFEMANGRKFEQLQHLLGVEVKR